MNYKYFFILIGLGLVIISCTKEKEEKTNTSKSVEIFNKLEHSRTNILFQNTLTENDSINYFTYTYIYMGGGVAAGDINNDGLTDLYFTGNQVSNKLYLNKGDLKFEDITDKAGVGGDNRWYTGVTMGDINGDGLLDIYCSVGGKFEPKQNQLFINNGDNTFTEKAAELGLDDSGHSVQATFFDYDKDGDLDAYVCNYPPTKFNAPNFYYVYKMKNVKDIESDHLFRNDGGSFTDVTDEAGVRSFGLTLGATVGDLNNDSWPDLYVSNDFSSPDYLYLNNGDGTFREVVKQATGHTSYYGMGLDIADYNNDGHLDIYQVDMDAVDNRRKKANMASMKPELFWSAVNSGFHYQYIQNCLQLNTGIYSENGEPYYTEISRLAGISSTDWSWGPLFADFNNDGYKDVFVSNGTRREINNNDYFNNLSSKITEDNLLETSQNIPSEKIDNFIFKNNGDLTFERANELWGIEDKGFANGLAYADLDNDGDLEIITNNIDDYVTVFENKSSEINNYITVKLQGKKNNKFGLGSRVYVQDKKNLEVNVDVWGSYDSGVKLQNKVNVQMQEMTLTRGFQSSVAPELHFGVGKQDTIYSINVVWPDGNEQEIKHVKANQTLTLQYKDAEENSDPKSNEVIPIFTTLNDSIFPQYKHVENEYDDFKRQALLPHKMSTLGPGITVGDLNGDNKEDFVVGGASGQATGIFFQKEDGFEKQTIPAFEKGRRYEDMGIAIFDANYDGYNDVYVVSGGNEVSADSELLQDRLYLNDGSGNFRLDESALPKMITSGSRVYNADLDFDGKEDLLVLGRQVPWSYPSPAKSHILKNVSENGEAKFLDVTKEMAPEFESLGMATDACITDYNSDGWLDIIVVGEWMPIRVFKNDGETFTEVSEEAGLKNTTGWWWSIESGDFDDDGDPDYIVGNYGHNYKHRPSKGEPLDVYYNDFDKNNKKDIVIGYYYDGKKYPLRGRESTAEQIPGIKEKFPDYSSYAKATLEEVYSESSLESALHYQAETFSSVYLENSAGEFTINELPVAGQLSSINQILVEDYNKDGNKDAIIAGNLYGTEVETARNDAGYGFFLKGNGEGAFIPTPPNISGLFVPGNVKDMAVIEYKNKRIIIAAKNDDYLQFIEMVN